MCLFEFQTSFVFTGTTVLFLFIVFVRRYLRRLSFVTKILKDTLYNTFFISLTSQHWRQIIVGPCLLSTQKEYKNIV